MSRRLFDGMVMGTEDGRLVRVFEPKWWQFARWIWWWFCAPAKGRVVLQVKDALRCEVRVYQETRVKPASCVIISTNHAHPKPSSVRDLFGATKEKEEGPFRIN